MYLPRLEEIRSFCGAPVLRPLRLEKNPTIQEGSYHQPLTIDNRPLTTRTPAPLSCLTLHCFFGENIL